MTRSGWRLEKNPLVASRVINGEVLLVPVRQSGPEIRKAYRLRDPVSVRIWELLDGQRTIPQIHGRLCQEFDTTALQAKKDLRRFLRELTQLGALRARKGTAS